MLQLNTTYKIMLFDRKEDLEINITDEFYFIFISLFTNL